jgi:hypothetical protein
MRVRHAATKRVTEFRAGEGTEQSANGEHSNHGSLDSLLVSLHLAGGGDSVHLWEGVGEVAKREKATNTRLVVSEQDEGRHDDQQQLGRLKLLSCEHHDCEGIRVGPGYCFVLLQRHCCSNPVKEWMCLIVRKI